MLVAAILSRGRGEVKAPGAKRRRGCGALDLRTSSRVLRVSLRLARDSAFEGNGNRDAMSTPPKDDSSVQDGAARGQLSADISTAVVHLFSKHTGRGPTKARTTLDAELVVVLLQNNMTKGEKSLAGKTAEVLQTRRTFQQTMRPELAEAAERVTKRNVVSFMSATSDQRRGPA